MYKIYKGGLNFLSVFLIVIGSLLASFNLSAQTCNIPSSVTVGTSCSCHNCSGTIQVVNYETYIKRVLHAEWYGCWGSLPDGMHSMNAGAVAIRSYTIPRMNNPVYINAHNSGSYDICSSTCCHAYSTAQNTNANMGVDNTTGIVLTNNAGTIMLSEYAAEQNNHPNCGNGKKGDGSGAWPCTNDGPCSGKTYNGHGRGMCQWGSARWATGNVLSGCNLASNHPYGKKTWQQILSHYYPNWVLTQCGVPADPPPPTVSTNVCGNKTLTRGTPPSGVTYYWQGTSCGTSTANSSLTYIATVSGTYYLRARSSSGTWSAGCSSVSVTVNPYPSAPPAPTSSTNFCGPKTLTRATPPSGVTYFWQGTSCGTSTASSSLNYTATASGTYYLRARSNAGCWSSSCSSVNITVNPLPPTPPSPTASNNGCGPIVLSRANPPSGQTYYWQGTSCGTSTANSASTYTAASSGTYYLRSQDGLGCWSACASITITVVDCPTNLAASFVSCPAAEVTFNWNNSGSNWGLDVSLDPAFNTLHAVSISNTTSINGPQGFTPAFFFQPNATYYWRISANGNVPGGVNNYFYGPDFNIPFCDLFPPSTMIDTIPGWQDSSFTANFTDADNIGVGKSFYRVMDFNGTEWRANPARGFLNDNFDNSTLSGDWTIYSGTWANTAGLLVQSDDTQNNTNLSTDLTQNLSNRYLYHWNAKIEGAGTNRRAGLHFFSDDASLPNRGNSYFVWFRIDDNKLQFYKVVNDVFTLKKSVDYTFNPSEYYDFKLIYDRITGKMDMYINNILADSWVDASPIASGDYVSFRTGNATMNVNYFKAFRSRYPSVLINVGSGNTNDIRFENAAPTLAAGKIESIVSDVEGSLSALSSTLVDVDWTPPSAVSSLNDGPGADISTTYLMNELTANWAPSVDPNSGIAKYFYSIGTAPGAMDLLGWTDNFLQVVAVNNALSLVLNETYYFNVRSENGAGMFSSVISSDGQMVIVNSTDVDEENPVSELNLYPNPFSNATILDYSLLRPQQVSVSLYDLTGREVAVLKNEMQKEGSYKVRIDGLHLGLAEGMYMVTFKTPETSAYIKIVFNRH